jgi:integrase
MPRPPLEPGEWGEISHSTAPNGKIRARTRYRTPLGQLIQVEKSGKTEAEATRRLRAAIKKWQPEEGKTLFRDVSALWLANLREHAEIRPQSINAYERTIKTTLSGPLGSRNIGGIQPGQLEELLDRIHVDKPGMYGPAFTVCRGVFSFAARRGMIPHSPMTSIQRRKEKPKAPIRVPTLTELAELRGMVREWQAGPRRTQPLLDVVDLELSTAARISEALAAKWDVVDLDAGTIKIETTQVWVKGVGIVDQGETKEGKVLELTLPRFGLDMLRDRRERYPHTSYVFESTAGTMIARSNLDRAWRAARGEEFKWVTWKTFRKAVATLAAEELGTSTASKVLGHSNESTTRRHYIATDVTAVPDITAVLEALSGDKDLSFDD